MGLENANSFSLWLVFLAEVDLPVAEHLLHILPAVFVADILIIQVGVSAEQLQKIKSIPAALRSVFVLDDLMISRKRKITHADSFGFRCKRSKWTDHL